VRGRVDESHRGAQREAAEEQQDDGGDSEFGSGGGFQRMKTLIFTLILALALAAACEKAKISNADKPLSVPGEKIYALQGKIVGRDAAENSLTIDHEAIPGYMEAMTMDYIVRGAKVDALPPNGTAIAATLHVTDDKGIWITGLRAGDAAHRPPQSPAAQPPAASR
jgi:Cu/Ag efflux protein CusF